MSETVAPETIMSHLGPWQLLDEMSDAVSIADVEGSLVYVNQAWLRILDIPDRETALAVARGRIHEHVLGMRPDVGLPRSEELAILRAMRGEEVRDSELIYTRPDGTHLWLSTSARPIRAPDGTILGALAVSRDVTRIRLLEQQHEHERLRLHAILQQAPFGMILFDVPGFRVVEHNPAALEFVAPPLRSGDSFVGCTVAELADGGTAAALEQLFHRAIMAETTIVVPEFSGMTRSDTSPRTYRGAVTPLFGADGTIQQVLTCSVDITEQVRTRQEIELLAAAAEARAEELAAIINSMADAVIITDEETRAMLWNPSYAALLGEPRLGETSAERVKNYNLRYWDGRAVPPDEMTAVRAVREVQEAVGEYIADTPTGREASLRIRATPLRDARGKIRGSVVVIRDMTAIHQVEKQKDEFLSLVSHELRTPVTIINGFTQVLRRSVERADVADTQRRLGTIERQVQQLTGLINELLDLSRVNTGRFECALAPFDYSSLVITVMDEMRQLHPNRIFVLHIDADVQVEGDSARLRQVLVNLLDNAVKHGPPNSEVKITIEVDDRHVTTYVCDEGAPLPFSERDKVFDRFYRVSPGPVRNGGSLGLGLFISRSIVAAHGGRIWVADDDHSSFAFSLRRIAS